MSMTPQQLQAFIESGKIGEKDASVTNNPFLIQTPKEDGSVGFNTPEVNKILDEVPIKDSLKLMYQIIGNTGVEMYFNQWILLSLTKVKEQYNHKVDKLQRRAIDFAIAYAGMGHVVVCSYDPETSKIYYRHDGGSNGYECGDRFKFSVDYVPEPDKCFDLQHWIEATNIIGDQFDLFKLPLVNQ